MNDRLYLVLLAVAAVLLIGLVLAGATGFENWPHKLIPNTMFASAGVVALTAWLSLRSEKSVSAAAQRNGLILILAVAAVLRLILLPATPFSTDIYRYIWDGRIQAAGINPYLYFPADPALVSYRDPDIYPLINRVATAPTIYPPFAQIVFFIVTRISEKVWAMKLAMVAFEAVAVAATLMLLKARRLPPTRVLIFAWHPLAVYEFAGSGHVDAIPIACMLLACVAADRQRRGATGALVAAGVLAKFFPLVVAPALYRRWDWRAATAGLLVLIAGYATYIGVGWKVFGYLPGYMEEENLASGDGFFLLGLTAKLIELPSWSAKLYVATGGLILLALAFAAIFRSKPEAPSMLWAVILLTAFTIFLSPHLPWYFLWILPLLCIAPSVSLFYMTAAAPVLYNEAGIVDMVWRGAVIYIPFALLLAVETAIRFRGRSPASGGQSARQTV